MTMDTGPVRGFSPMESAALAAAVVLAAGAAGAACAGPAVRRPAPPAEAGTAGRPALGASPLAAEFDEVVEPLLVSACSPCHFEGGRVYLEMPFDDESTVLRMGESLFSRLTDERDRDVLRAFFARAGRAPGEAAPGGAGDREDREAAGG